MSLPCPVVVSSTDGYRDAWTPFLTLIERYCPAAWSSIVLITDTIEAVPGCPDVRVIAVEATLGRRTTWAENLRHVLDRIDASTFLYLQEDYFLERAANVGLLREAHDLVHTRRADGIVLVDVGPQLNQRVGSGWRPIDPASRDLVSLQASFWNVEAFRRLLRRHESPWEFENYGSRRARRDGYRVLGAGPELMCAPGLSRVLPYRQTGIVHGRWRRDIVEPLFEAEAIAVEFHLRGWHSPHSRLPSHRVVRAWKRIRRLPRLRASLRREGRW